MTKAKRKIVKQRHRRHRVRRFHVDRLWETTHNKLCLKFLDLPAGFKTFRDYVESLFYNHSGDGRAMTWENRGDWNLHHIVPLREFNLLDPLEQRAAKRAENVQPLWVCDHIELHRVA